MKFAHIADCHIGGWRDERLSTLTIESFKEAVKKCVNDNVGFVLISGDLFDTAMPSIDLIKETAKELNKLREANIEVYCIPGSHDFSPTGKTILDVFEKSKLLNNVNKFKDNKLQFMEDKTNVKITGLLGRKGSLEINDYEELNKEHLENEEGFKIFMFHTALEEFKPEDLKKVEGMLTANLPKNFDYYAGGHVHYIFDTTKEKGKIVFPGPLFPNNFKEIEELKQGGFYIVDDKLNLEYVKIKLKEVLSLKIKGENVNDINEKIRNSVRDNDVKDKIVTLRVEGVLEEGKVSDIDFKNLIKEMEEKGAYIVLKNTNKLTTKEFEEFKLEGDVEDIEEELIKKHIGQVKINFNEEEMTKKLMEVMNIEKIEGETNAVFEERVNKSVLKVLGLENVD